MFGAIRDAAASKALAIIKEKFVNPNFEGIGKAREIAYRDRKVYLTIELEGLEDRPFEVVAEKIEFAPDCSSVRVSEFSSNMPFLHNALNRFATREFSIPESKRGMFALAKKALGL